MRQPTGSAAFTGSSAVAVRPPRKAYPPRPPGPPLIGMPGWSTGGCWLTGRYRARSGTRPRRACRCRCCLGSGMPAAGLADDL